MSLVVSVLLAVRSLVRSPAALHLEILALRQQLQVGYDPTVGAFV
jgi:hypothetical protein